jgi:hypothetical protein
MPETEKRANTISEPVAKQRNKFGIDERILKQAEEDSLLLDSLNEISERQMHTQREPTDMDHKDNGLLHNLLEDQPGLLPFNYESF